MSANPVITGDEELIYPATYAEPGLFQVEIPVDGVEAGTYTILIDATLEGAMPASFTGATVIY